MSSSIDIRRARITTGVKWGVGLLGAALLAPVAFLAIKGLLGLMVAAFLGASFIAGARPAGSWIATQRLKAEKVIARVNPIEQKEKHLLAARERIGVQASILKGVMAEVDGFADMVKGMPADEQADFLPQVAKQRQLVTFRQTKLKEAVAKADAFEAGLERARRKWAVVQKLLGLQKLNGSDKDAQMERILNEEANESIDNAMRSAMAEMDLAFVMESPTIEAPKDPSVIDVTDISIRERLHA